MKINLHEGIDAVKFGMSLSDVETILGKADVVDKDNEGDLEIVFAEYEEKGLSLCFEKNKNEEQALLADITPYGEETTLFGAKIYDLNKEEIIRLCEQNNLEHGETDSNFNEEEMLLFEDGGIAFFFENNELVSVSFSK